MCMHFALRYDILGGWEIQGAYVVREALGYKDALFAAEQRLIERW